MKHSEIKNQKMKKRTANIQQNLISRSETFGKKFTKKFTIRTKILVELEKVIVQSRADLDFFNEGGITEKLFECFVDLFYGDDQIDFKSPLKAILRP